VRKIRSSELITRDGGIGSLLRKMLLARRRREFFRSTTLLRTIMQIVCNWHLASLHCPFELAQAVCKFFDISEIWSVSSFAIAKYINKPFARPPLHRYSAELADCSYALAA
jgi:hypothetical protein